MSAAGPDRGAVAELPATRAELAARLEPLLLPAARCAALDSHGHVDAAVLVALFVRDGRPHAVFTRRREHLRRHAGEISFPGGRQDDEDPDLIHTALREAREEIGLPAGAVAILGALQPIPTIATAYSIYPFVGLIEPDQSWLRSEGEVSEVLELALADLCAGYARRQIERRGVPFRTDAFVVGEQLIWGATARILSDLLERLGPPLLTPPA